MSPQHIQYLTTVKELVLIFRKTKKYNLIDPIFNQSLVLMCSDVSKTKTIFGEYRASSHWLVEFSVMVKNKANKSQLPHTGYSSEAEVGS